MCMRKVIALPPEVRFGVVTASVGRKSAAPSAANCRLHVGLAKPMMSGMIRSARARVGVSIHCRSPVSGGSPALRIHSGAVQPADDTARSMSHLEPDCDDNPARWEYVRLWAE